MHVVVILDLMCGVKSHCDVWLRLFLFFLFKHKKMTSKHMALKDIWNPLNPFLVSLTCSCHPDTLRLLAWLADSRWVVRSDTEAVLPLRLQAWADVVGCALTAARDFSPALTFLLPDLYDVAQHGCAPIVAGTSPRQDQGLSGELGYDRLGCRRVWPV